MLQALQTMIAPAVLQRLTLLINHVLAAEPAATGRLQPHAGRRLRLHLDGWPALLPAPPALAFVVTPAGLLEWQGLDAGPEAELQIHVDASNPARLAAQALAGETPTLEVRGDAALATDINWLVDHLRWDIEADLEPLVGPRVAHELVRFGAALARGLRRAAGGLRERSNPPGPGASA